MARRKYRVFRILGWMVVGCISLILILTLGFYLGRGWIMQRAVSYVNEIQPGELVEITSGLEEGQAVVVSGQFLIDSESNLRAAISSLLANRSGHQH